MDDINEIRQIPFFKDIIKLITIDNIERLTNFGIILNPITSNWFGHKCQYNMIHFRILDIYKNNNTTEIILFKNIYYVGSCHTNCVSLTIIQLFNILQLMSYIIIKTNINILHTKYSSFLSTYINEEDVRFEIDLHTTYHKLNLSTFNNNISIIINNIKYTCNLSNIDYHKLNIFLYK